MKKLYKWQLLLSKINQKTGLPIMSLYFFNIHISSYEFNIILLNKNHEVMKKKLFNINTLYLKGLSIRFLNKIYLCCSS